MMDSEALYTALAAHFERTNPLQKGGTTLEYLDTEQVISRLTEVLGPDGWTFVVREHGRDDDVMWVLGHLRVRFRDDEPDGWIAREQFGECQVTRGMASGDARKGACSDALKKCASLFGVGLYLSDKEEQAARRNASRASAPASSANGASVASPSAPGGSAQVAATLPTGTPPASAAPASTRAAGAPDPEPVPIRPLTDDEAERWAQESPLEREQHAPKLTHSPTGEPAVVTAFYERCERELKLGRDAVLERLKAQSLKEACANRKYPTTPLHTLAVSLGKLYDDLAVRVDQAQPAGAPA